VKRRGEKSKGRSESSRASPTSNVDAPPRTIRSSLPRTSSTMSDLSCTSCFTPSDLASQFRPASSRPSARASNGPLAVPGTLRPYLSFLCRTIPKLASDSLRLHACIIDSEGRGRCALTLLRQLQIGISSSFEQMSLNESPQSTG
jgi:hypothetical protein